MYIGMMHNMQQWLMGLAVNCARIAPKWRVACCQSVLGWSMITCTFSGRGGGAPNGGRRGDGGGGQVGQGGRLCQVADNFDVIVNVLADFFEVRQMCEGAGFI